MVVKEEQWAETSASWMGPLQTVIARDVEESAMYILTFRSILVV